MRRRSEDVHVQLLCHRALKAARRHLSPSELIAVLGLSPVDLSRYTSGIVLPSPPRARELLDRMWRMGVVTSVLERVTVVDENGVVNISKLAFDVDLITLAVAAAYGELCTKRISKVLTAAVNGVPLATILAETLGAELVVAKHELDASSKRYIEVRYFAPEPPRYASLYVPEYELSPNDRVLIADDLLRSGRTLAALAELTARAGATPVCVFALVALGQGWRSVAESRRMECVVCLEIPRL